MRVCVVERARDREREKGKISIQTESVLETPSLSSVVVAARAGCVRAMEQKG